MTRPIILTCVLTGAGDTAVVAGCTGEADWRTIADLIVERDRAIIAIRGVVDSVRGKRP